jgi:histidinol dehydrogenase
LRIIHHLKLGENFFKYKGLSSVSSVQKIITDVKKNGDKAIEYYTSKFDGVTLKDIKVNLKEIKGARSLIDHKIVLAINLAANNIRSFSKKQLEQFKNFEYEIAPGVHVGQKVIPIERVGVYVPSGRFPLVSTLLMCAIPAQVANVKEIVVCSPPRYGNSIHPVILVVSEMIRLNEIYKVGGAQAIAAMAYGTETIKKVDKIVGPGNEYVTAAKREVFGAVGIDFIAGPTEIMIIADKTADPQILAADLLAQAEHDTNAHCILITDALRLAEEVSNEVERQLKELTTKDIARQSINMNGMIIITDNIAEAVEIANKKAPEHLELQIENPEDYVDRFKNYGSLFIDEYSAETLGDYSSGLNHTLPTNGCARYTGGLSVKDFLKLQTTLRVTKEGLSGIGPVAETLGELEGMNGHIKSIALRSNKIT